MLFSNHQEEGRKTQRATVTAHKNRSRNPPSNAAWMSCCPSLPWAAHHPEPQHCFRSTSRPRRLCGQPLQAGQLAGRWGACGFKGAASHFPEMATAPQPTMGISNRWVSQAPLVCGSLGLNHRFFSCPPPGLTERGVPAGADPSGQYHATYRTAEGP